MTLFVLASAGPNVASAVDASPVRQQCVQGAAQHYQLHPNLIRAILRQEAGTAGRVSWNSNGTYDMGPMQINSDHLGELAKYGITREQLIQDECLNIYIGTWMLKREIASAPNVWVGIGNYHSRTPGLNASYQWSVWRRLRQVSQGG